MLIFQNFDELMVLNDFQLKFFKISNVLKLLWCPLLLQSPLEGICFQILPRFPDFLIIVTRLLLKVVDSNQFGTFVVCHIHMITTHRLTCKEIEGQF